MFVYILSFARQEFMLSSAMVLAVVLTAQRPFSLLELNLFASQPSQGVVHF